MLEDYSQPNDGPTWTDRIEWFVDRAFRGAALLCSPWRWFRAATDEGQFYARQGRRVSILYRIQYPFLFLFEAIAINFSRCLDWLEFFMAAVISRAGRIFSFRRPPDNSELDVDG